VSYSRVGAVVMSGGTPAVVSARPLLGDMLSKLILLANSSITFNGKTAQQFKIQPSNAPDLDPEPCQAGTFTQCSGNIVLWPSGDFAVLESSWEIAASFVGSTKAFALRLTNVATAIEATVALLAQVDARLRAEGLPIKTKSTSYLPWIIGGGALVGAVLSSLKKGKPTRGRRKPRRRTARRRR
jgi:hypothetical protein